MKRSGLMRAARWMLIGMFLGGPALGVVLAPGAARPGALPFTALIYGLVGMVVTGHRPRNPVGWVFLGAGAVQGFAWLAVSLSARGSSAAESAPTTANFLDVVANMTYIPTMLLFTLFTVLLYPEGLPSPRWRPILWAAVIAASAMTVGAAVAGTVRVGDVAVSNPYGSAAWNGRLFGIGGAVITACLVLGVISAALRIRRSVGVERAQMRWFASAVALVVALFTLYLVVPGLEQSRIGEVALFAALSCVPVSCGVAILRYRLYEIDRIISRTASYAVVTGLLLAVYFVIVTSVTTLLPKASNGFVVAAATLAAAAAFRPLLSRVQKSVDRRFDRERYDGLQAAEAFSARLRDETDPAAVAAEMTTVVQRTLQPGRLLLWIPGDVADER